VSTTIVEVSAGTDRARVTLRAGTIVPRLISRDRTAARVALVAGGALLLGGDAIDLRIVVGTGCSLELEDIGGTVAYDGAGQRATWDATVSVGDGASVAWHSLPFVVADGADVGRRTSIRLGAGASALLRETVVLGRTGERGGLVQMSTEVHDAAGPILVEELVLDGHAPVPGVVGAHRVVDAVMCFGRAAAAADTDVVTAGTRRVAVLSPERGGVLVRGLGAEAHLTDLADHWDRLATRPEEIRVVP
jgi:urease accessory protein